MRLIPSFLAALATLTALTACGTKTPLTLPTPAPPATQTAIPPAQVPAADDSNKAATERRQ